MPEVGSITRLIHQLNAGDKSAIQDLWERYFERIVAVARNKLQNLPPQLAAEEDVALSAFKSFFRAVEEKRFPKLENSGDLWQILMLITRNKSAKLWNYHTREKRHFSRVLDLQQLSPEACEGDNADFLEMIEDNAPDPQYVAEMEEELDRLLQMLPNEQMRQIALQKMEGATNQEIASELDCARATVERGLKDIRKYWQGKLAMQAENTIDHLPEDVAGSVLQELLAAHSVQLPQTIGDTGPGGDKPNQLLAGPTEISGRYQLHQHILGEGGQAFVQKGLDLTLKRDIAFKRPKKENREMRDQLQRFIVEAQITGQLQHPGIVPIYELGEFPDKQLYFTMKLVDGNTLENLLADRASPSEESTHYLKIFEQICQTLAYAHMRGVIHRDLKTRNVMVGAFGEVQVMDWGFAKVLNGTQDERPAQDGTTGIKTIGTKLDSGLTVDGTVMGTWAYMPPEIARGESADERSDVFGLGAILCEILTGKPPFEFTQGDNPLLIVSKADMAETFSRLDNCGADRDLVSLAQCCLAPERTKRPRDAGALTKELTAHLNSVEQRLRQAELDSVEARARAEEERRRRDITVAAQKELQQALTRQVAERLEGELSRLEIVGRSLTTLLEKRTDWEEDQVAAWMEAMLQQEDRIFGLYAAFESGQYRPEVENYGLYLVRDGEDGEIQKKYLVPPDYVYREWQWYIDARTKGRPHWTEPFIDTAGGDIPMVCYAVPFYRQGQLAGVVTVDLSVSYFQRLANWLKELDFGQSSYGLLISQEGVVISHPSPEYDFATLATARKPSRRFAELGGSGEAFTNLKDCDFNESFGNGSTINPTTGNQSNWLFARIHNSGWTFVAVVDETGDPAPS